MIIKFFITPVYPYGNDHYYHEMISVAEGFKELGHSIIGNCNYWFEPETNEYLIKENLEADFDIAIYDYRYVTSFAHLLFRKGYPNFDKTKKHILIDRNDWLQPVWWKNKHCQIFNLIFAGNLYTNVKYADNVKPWAIGLTNRIIRTIDKFYKTDYDREGIVGYNFRVNHNMRGYVLQELKNTLKKYHATERFTKPNFDNSTDEFYYKQSVRRHNPEYYKSLCSSKFFMGFGGYYELKPFRYLPYNFFDKVLRKPHYWKYNGLKKNNKDFSDEIFIFQHDNFRFWEVLYSGAIAINLDMNYWNFCLPETPVNGVHYIGIDKLKDNQIEKQISSLNEDEIKNISSNARQWVFENYSPKAQAQRIINYLNV
ncbi:MAG: hypothetical protein KF900_12355 [Bacteroidetes bacterium]|nr:hypothetical protein [Bacteroidota bacterium]